MGWAVSANERGLEVASCIDGPSGADIKSISWSVLKKRDRARAVGDALVAVTHELVLRHKEVTIARSEEYRQDVEQLREQLPRHLETLVRQEANRYPGFLEKELPINIPVS